MHRFGLSIAVLLAERHVHAESSSAQRSAVQFVVVSPPLCEADSFPLVSFLDSLRVELAGRGLGCCALKDPREPIQKRASLRLTLEFVPCAAGADRVQITALGPDGVRAADREISLGDVAIAARPRALALAAAELIRSIQNETREEMPATVAVAEKRLVPSPTPPRPEVPQRVALSMGLEAEARYLPIRDTTLWGGRLRITALRRALHADFDVGANYSHTRVELGELFLQSASVGLGAGPRLVTQAAILDVGLHAEVGWAWISGKSEFADVRTAAGSDVFSSLGFRGSLEAPAEFGIRPALTLECGGVVRSFKGDVNGKLVTGITGYYLLAALGVAVTL